MGQDSCNFGSGRFCALADYRALNNNQGRIINEENQLFLLSIHIFACSLASGTGMQQFKVCGAVRPVAPQAEPRGYLAASCIVS
jgi:hypothetical protein